MHTIKYYLTSILYLTSLILNTNFRWFSCNYRHISLLKIFFSPDCFKYNIESSWWWKDSFQVRRNLSRTVNKSDFPVCVFTRTFSMCYYKSSFFLKGNNNHSFEQLSQEICWKNLFVMCSDLVLQWFQLKLLCISNIDIYSFYSTSNPHIKVFFLSLIGKSEPFYEYS